MAEEDRTKEDVARENRTKEDVTKEDVDIEMVMDIVDGKLVYCCPRCDYSSQSNGHLQKHLKSHKTSYVPEKCVIHHPCTKCAQSFSDEGQLFKHFLRSHTEKRKKPEKEKTIKIKLVNEYPVKKKPGKKKAPKERTVKEKPVKEKPIKEKTPKEKPIKEKPVQESPVNDLPLGERRAKLKAKELVKEKQLVKNVWKEQYSKNKPVPLTDKQGSEEQMKNSEKEYKCKICNLTFENKLALISHQGHHKRKFPRKLNRNELSSAPHACPVCNKVYSSSANCRRHIREHTDSRPMGELDDNTQVAYADVIESPDSLAETLKAIRTLRILKENNQENERKRSKELVSYLSRGLGLPNVGDKVISSGGQSVTFAKRGRRGRCDHTNITREDFMVFLTTGKLCGHSIAPVRFGLPG